MRRLRPRSGPIDWAAVRARIAASGVAIDAALAPSSERAHAVLEARARRIARPHEAPRPRDLMTLVTFRLGPEAYAIEARWVREVARLSSLTLVPGAPRCFFGVTPWRGEVLPVVDLRAYFGFAPRGVSDLSKMLVLGSDRAELGVLADETESIVEVQSGSLREPPTSGGPGAECLRGVTADARLVVDGRPFLEDVRLFIGRSMETASLGGVK